MKQGHEVALHVLYQLYAEQASNSSEIAASTTAAYDRFLLSVVCPLCQMAVLECVSSMNKWHLTCHLHHFLYVFELSHGYFSLLIVHCRHKDWEIHYPLQISLSVGFWEMLLYCRWHHWSWLKIFAIQKVGEKYQPVTELHKGLVLFGVSFCSGLPHVAPV